MDMQKSMKNVKLFCLETFMVYSNQFKVVLDMFMIYIAQAAQILKPISLSLFFGSFSERALEFSLLVGSVVS